MHSFPPVYVKMFSSRNGILLILDIPFEVDKVLFHQFFLPLVSPPCGSPPPLATIPLRIPRKPLFPVLGGFFSPALTRLRTSPSHPQEVAHDQLGRREGLFFAEYSSIILCPVSLPNSQQLFSAPFEGLGSLGLL